MARVKRRDVLRLAVGAGALGALALTGTLPRRVGAAERAQVVVVGGGAGGVTAAKYVRRLDPTVEVTLIEQNAAYVTPFGGNWVVGGLRDLDSLTQSYEALAKRHGVKVVHATVTAVDPVRRRVETQGGRSYNYDRCIVAPGIDFRWKAIDGYGPAVAERVPHAWTAGPQAGLLRRQLEAMPDGGVFVMSVPPAPFRCPPAPYERASLVAGYFKARKPRSKVIVLDANESFWQQSLFEAGWNRLYPGIIERRAGAEGRLTAVDGTRARTGASAVKADVLNVIPPQIAGRVARESGLADDGGWCAASALTWESARHAGVHVVGDAAGQGVLPKSAFVANTAGKACAAAVVALLRGQAPPVPHLVNVCYSLLAPQHGISAASVYGVSPEGRVSPRGEAGGESPPDASSLMEAVYAESWYNNIVDDMFS